MPGAIHTRPRPGREFLIMVSRSHLEERTKAYIGRFPHAELVQCGSSVKFCRLAEGAADLYARLAPTHDWDIAAGHADTHGRRRQSHCTGRRAACLWQPGTLGPGLPRLGRSRRIEITA